MLPLAGSTIPQSAPELATALKGGFEAHGITPREVTADGSWPSLDRLSVDLTGATISRERRIERALAPAGDGVVAKRLEIAASPLSFESLPFEISLRAEDAACVFAPTPGGLWQLVLVSAVNGLATIQASIAALEQTIKTLAAKAAADQGVEVKSVKLRFTERGPRALSLAAEISVKAFIATTTLTLSGNLDLDESLNARLSALRFGGEGMLASIAGGFIRPQLTKLEAQSLPLLSFLPTGLKLHDVQLQAGESLRISARFGG